MSGTLGERLKMVRKEMGLSQRAFGSPIGIIQNNISEYEKDIHEPSERVLSAIITHYQLNREWLLAGVGEKYSDGSNISVNNLTGHANNVGSNNNRSSVNSNEDYLKFIERENKFLKKQNSQLLEQNTKLMEMLGQKNK